jgi:hypothetical protein
MSTQEASNAPESEGLTTEAAEIFERAREAMMRLQKRSYEDWITIGHAVVLARKIADERGGRQTFKRLLEQQGLAPVVGDKATSTRLLAIMAELPEVTKWRATLATRQLVDWSAPTTIFRHCPIFQKPKPDGEAEAEKEPTWKEKYTMAQDRITSLETQLKRADGSLFDLRRDRPADIIDVMARECSESRFAELMRLGAAKLKALRKVKTAHAG